MAYTFIDGNIIILEWVALDITVGKLSQVKEMFDCLKTILLLPEEGFIYGSLRHDSSYQFYLSALKKGYIEELYTEALVDVCLPSESKELFKKLDDKYDNLDEMLEYEEEIDYSKYKKYILHDIVCDVTSEFVEKYKK